MFLLENRNGGFSLGHVLPPQLCKILANWFVYPKVSMTTHRADCKQETDSVSVSFLLL